MKVNCALIIVKAFLVSIADQKLREIREQVQTHLASVPARLTPERQKALEEKIREQLKAHNAVIVAHYYTSPEIQALAEATGGCVSDSLEMARFGRDHPAETFWWPVCALWARPQKS